MVLDRLTANRLRNGRIPATRNEVGKRPAFAAEMDHGVAVRANDSQILKPRLPGTVRFGQRPKMVDVCESLAERPIDGFEIEAASRHLAAQPPVQARLAVMPELGLALGTLA